MRPLPNPYKIRLCSISSKKYSSSSVLCPNCNSANVKKVIYGTFRDKDLRKLSEEHVSYRGCVTAGHEGGALPEYQCVSCKTEFNKEYICEHTISKEAGAYWYLGHYSRGKRIGTVERNIKILVYAERDKDKLWSAYHVISGKKIYTTCFRSGREKYDSKEKAWEATKKFAIEDIYREYPPDTKFKVICINESTLKEKLFTILKYMLIPFAVALLFTAQIPKYIADIPDFIKDIPNMWRRHKENYGYPVLAAIVMPLAYLIVVPLVVIIAGPFILLWDLIKKRFAPPPKSV